MISDIIENDRHTTHHQCMIRKKNIVLNQLVHYFIRDARLEPHQPFPRDGDGTHLRDIGRGGCGRWRIALNSSQYWCQFFVEIQSDWDE